MKILTWNLFHGRSVPSAGRSLQAQFTERIASWPWDVAMLQEVPPWWPEPLARASDAQARRALTSRNELLFVRRSLAERWPDVLKSSGGGCNAILVRGEAIVEHREIELRRRPLRRVCHGVRLASGLWCVNMHCETKDELATADTAKAADAALGWAGGAPLLFGGDVNLEAPRVETMRHLGGNWVDHIFGRGVGAAGPVELPDRGTLSDHGAVLVTVEVRTRQAGP